MTNFRALSLLLLSSASIISPALAQMFDIIEICKQTPEMTGWGEYLEKNPDIYYQYYADLHDKSIFIPSNKALEDYYNSSYSIHRRDDATRNQNIFVADLMGTRISRSAGYKRSDEEIHLEARQAFMAQGGSQSIILETLAEGNNRRKINIGVQLSSKVANSQIQQRTFKGFPEPKPPGMIVSTGLGQKSNIMFGSLQAKQGILWVIDKMFEFPESVSSSLEKTGLSKFGSAVEEAGFQEKYDKADLVTIFAPIDESFNSSCSCSGLSTEAVEDHVVYGAALYDAILKDGTVFKTCQGKKLKVTVEDGETYVNGVKVVKKDIITLNGVIHGLERPLVDSDYDHEEWSKTESATPIATEYRTYYEASTTVVEVKVTSTFDVPTGTWDSSSKSTSAGYEYASVTARSPAETTGASVAVPDTTGGSNSTSPATPTPTPQEFTGSASMLRMVDMRITLGTVVLALATFMF